MYMTVNFKEAAATGRLDAGFLIRNSTMKSDIEYNNKISNMDMKVVKEVFSCLDSSVQKEAVDKIKRGSSAPVTQDDINRTLNEYPLLCLYQVNLQTAMEKYTEEINDLNTKLQKLRSFAMK